MTPIGKGGMTNPRGTFPLVSLLNVFATTRLANGAAVDARSSTDNW